MGNDGGEDAAEGVRRRRPAEIVESERVSRNLPFLSDEKVLNDTSHRDHRLGVGHPIPCFDELPIVGGDEKDILTCRAADGIGHARQVRIRFVSEFTQILDDNERAPRREGLGSHFVILLPHGGVAA